MQHKFARTGSPVHPLIAQRWSSRAIDANQPVAREQLQPLLEAAQWAPSCFGAQPWYFVVFDRFEDESAWQQAEACLMEGNRRWASRAPLLVLALADKLLNGEENRWAEYDVGAAVENLVLQASAQKLVARQIGGFELQKTIDQFAIPANLQPMVFIAIGHPTEDVDHLLDEHQQAEKAQRQRNPLSDHVFAGQWGNPYSKK